MLENMFLGLGEAAHDRLLDFSTAHTGNLFFVPSLDFLEDPGVAGSPAESQDEAPVEAEPPSDGSLGIGGLR